jgi:hypothetical protein
MPNAKITTSALFANFNAAAIPDVDVLLTSTPFALVVAPPILYS